MTGLPQPVFKPRPHRIGRCLSIRWAAIAACAAVAIPLAGCSFTTGSGGANSVPPDWQTIARRWANAYSTQSGNQSPTVPLATGQVVSVDIARVASRLPAWRLADALQKGGHGIALPPLPPSGGVSQLPSPEGTSAVRVEGYSSVARRVAPTDLDGLRHDAADLQLAAMREFITVEARREDYELRNRLLALQAALADDIEVARRAPLPAIAPAQLPAGLQLELANLKLRLQILANMPVKTDSEGVRIADQKKAVQTRIDAIETQWAAELRRQREQRQAEVNRMQIDEPARLKAAGEAKIRQLGAAAAQSAAAARSEAIDAQRKLVEADFTRTGENDYQLHFPSLDLPPGSLNLPAASGQGVAAGPGSKNQIEPAPPSEMSIAVAPYTAPKAQILALRASAMRDARLWTRIAVHRAGWKLPEDLPSGARAVAAPDRTKEILSLLHL